MPVRITPLEAPPLYPANPAAILEAVYNEIYIASDRQINDFSEHSPAAALSEGLLLCLLEELYYVNTLPDALGIAFLKVAGFQRILGRATTVTLTFTLTTTLGNAFTLSPGYICKDNAGHEFATDSLLTIPAGQVQGSVTATATAILNGIRQPAMGKEYNVPAYTIKHLTETRAFLKSVINLEPASGGLGEETLAEARSRAYTTLRRRATNFKANEYTLISPNDYEELTKELLGAGSVAIAIGHLASDRQTYEKGAIHVFVLSPDRTAPNQSQINTVRSTLAKQSPAGLQTLVSVSPVELFPLEVVVIANLIPGSDPPKVAQRIQARLDEYFTPGELPLGEPVLLKEVENVVRNSGVKSLQAVWFLLTDGAEVEAHYSDVPLPNRWSAAVLYSLEITLVDTTTANTSFSYSFGDGGDKE